MGKDIYVIHSGVPIKNGGAVVRVPGTGAYQAQDDRVNNLPVIADIEFKYDDRLTRVRYYSGDTTG